MRLVDFLMFGFEQYWRPKNLRRINAAWQAGTRARDWPPDSIRKICAYRSKDGIEAYCNLLAYYHSYDSDDLDQARAHMERAFQLVKARGAKWAEIREIILIERVFFSALVMRDLPAAIEAAEMLPLRMYPSERLAKPNAGRAMAALLILEGRSEEARKILDRTEEDLNNRKPADNIRAELDWCQKVREMA